MDISEGTCDLCPHQLVLVYVVQVAPTTAKVQCHVPPQLGLCSQNPGHDLRVVSVGERALHGEAAHGGGAAIAAGCGLPTASWRLEEVQLGTLKLCLASAPAPRSWLAQVDGLLDLHEIKVSSIVLLHMFSPHACL